MPQLKMKKRWKFLLFVSVVTISVFSALAYFLFANEAPIVSGQVERNIIYKNDLKLDIYLPTQNVYRKTPVVIYIHGGAWIGGMKEGLNFNRFNEVANALRASGYAFISINYTLARSNQSPFPTCIEDAADAVNWIQQHAADYNFDLNNVGLFGESAGAHIAMMVAYAQSPNQDLSSLPFRYVVEVYGPTRLKDIYSAPPIDTLYRKLTQLPESIRGYLDLPKYIFGFDPKQDSVRALEMMEAYSPYNFVTASAPPTLLIHGNKDRVVPVDQSIQLQTKLDSLKVINEIHLVEGADHAFVNAAPEQKATLQKWIVDFILRYHADI